MATHDYNIANQGFPAFRADLNDALAAIVSNNSNATAPATTFAHMVWVDTAADPSILKIRNADNDAWITIGSINQTDDKFKLTPADGVSTDTISELTSAAGVTIDGVLLKDSGVGSAASPVSLNSLNYPTEGSVNFRNRIINGDMRIAQRGTAAVTGNVTFPVDRWQITNSSNASVSAQQDSDVPAGQGFSFSTKYTVTTADASVTGTEDALFRHLIEGFNTSDFAWGTASAKTVTLSFWVRSSVTGTFGGALKNSGNTRSYPFTYSISAANTWEYKTITIAGETSGTWVADNGIGVRVVFSLGSGGDRLGTADAWGSANYDGATGQTQLISTLNATWYITGVQLEVGSVATPFERRDYGRELIMCQRYYYRNTAPSGSHYGSGFNDSTSNALIAVAFPVTMRTNPSALEQSGTAGHYAIQRSGDVPTCTSVPTFSSANTQVALVQFVSSSNLTAGQGSIGRSANSSGYLAWSAEL